MAPLTRLQKGPTTRSKSRLFNIKLREPNDASLRTKVKLKQVLSTRTKISNTLSKSTSTKKTLSIRQKKKLTLPSPSKVENGECISCVEKIVAETKSFKMACGHVFCFNCVKTRLSIARKDRTMIPAHCCQIEFPITYVNEILDKKDYTFYNRVVEERDWKKSTLKSDAEYKNIVSKNGGKQCPKCGIGVLKDGGCNAVICIRGHEFCFGCASEKCMCR
jgi:hypothetical protein